MDNNGTTQVDTVPPSTLLIFVGGDSNAVTRWLQYYG